MRGRRVIVLAAVLAVEAGALVARSPFAHWGHGPAGVAVHAGVFSAPSPPTTGAADDLPLVSLVPLPTAPPGAPAPVTASGTPKSATAVLAQTIQLCQPTQVHLGLVTAHSVYRIGDIIRVSASFTNPAGNDCWLPTRDAAGACQPQITLRAASGAGFGPYTRVCPAATRQIVPAHGVAGAAVNVPFAPAVPLSVVGS